MRLQLLEMAPAKATKKPPLLFVHGAFCAAWVWQEFFMPWFANHGYHCYALSLRGHGESEGQSLINNWSLADYVKDAQQVIGELPKLPLLVGHSMGAVVVQKLLEKEDYPAAVLMSPSPPDGLMAPFGMINPNMMNALWGGVGGTANGNALADMLFPKQTPARKARYVKALEPSESLRVSMDMSMGDTVVLRRGLKTPITVIGAENDALISLQQLQRIGKRYSVEAQIVPGISHVMMLDQPWKKAAELVLKGLAK